MEVQIREINKEDVLELKNLFKQTITSNFIYEDLDEYEKVIKNLISDQVDDVKDYFGNKIRIEEYIVAEYDGKIVGTTAYGEVSEIISSNIEINDETKEIKAVYILPEFQGKRIGSRLFEEIINRMKKSDIKEYCLYSGYKKGKAFWLRKLGKLYKVLEDYYAKDDHCEIWKINFD